MYMYMYLYLLTHTSDKEALGRLGSPTPTHSSKGPIHNCDPLLIF